MFAGFLTIVWFLLGAVGQSLHKQKSVAQLMQGTLPKPGDPAERDDELSHTEAYQFARPITLSSILVGVACAALAFHHGLMIYLALPLGLLGFIVVTAIGMLAVAGSTP